VEQQTRGSLAILPDQKIVMVWHQAICDDRNSRGLSVLLEQAQEIMVICLFKENRLASAAAVIDMIELTFDKGHHSVGHFTPVIDDRHLGYVPVTLKVTGTCSRVPFSAEPGDLFPGD